MPSHSVRNRKQVPALLPLGKLGTEFYDQRVLVSCSAHSHIGMGGVLNHRQDDHGILLHFGVGWVEVTLSCTSDRKAMDSQKNVYWSRERFPVPKRDCQPEICKSWGRRDAEV